MKTWFAFFFLISSLCFAKSDKLLDGANPNPLSNYEGLPSSIVAGSVNVITGDYFENSVDLTLPLPFPVNISRSYTSSDTFGQSFEEGSLFYGWNINHGGELTLHLQDDADSFHNYCQLRSAGMNLQFDQKENRKKHQYLLARELFKHGLTNTGQGAISGQTNLRNIRVVHDKKENQYIITDGSGTEKRFERVRHYHYRLLSEKRPNETTIKYDYTNDELSRISVLNSQNEEIGWIKLNRPDSIRKNSQIVVESSDNRHIYYNFSKHKGKCYILSQAHRTEGPAELYEYEPLKKRAGYFSRITERKYASGLTRRIKFHEVESKDTTVAPHSYIDCRVKELYESPSENPIYTFDYVKPNWKNHFEGKTIVKDALGRVDTYTYDSQLRLTKVRGPRRLESYWWGKDEKDGDLLQRVIEEPGQHISLAICYHYDDHGNVINHQTYGCFTGTDSRVIGTGRHGFIVPDGSEHYDIKRQYSNDGLNLLVREDNGRHIKTFEYKPKTNLKIKEFLCEGDTIRKRHFYSYDKNSAIQEEIIDDGCRNESFDLSDVTHRLITRYKNSEQSPVGFPIEIAHYAVDLSNGSEILISREVNFYNPRGLVLSKSIYGADNQLSHTLNFDYDIQGNLIKKIDAKGYVTTYTYNLTNQLITEIGPDYIKHFEYDIQDRLITETNNGQVSRFAYDAMGRKIYSIDPFGQKTTYAHDCEGNVSCETLPSGGQIHTSYNLLNHPIRIIDPCGNTIETKTNVRGQPIQIDYPDKSFEQKTYTLDGLLKTHRFRDGHEIIYEYDYQGRVIAEKVISEDCILSETHKTYDAFNLLSETDANGFTTYYQYDSANRLVNTRKGQSEKHITYDSNGQICEERIKATNEDAIVTRFEYDVNGNIVKRTQLNGFGDEHLCTEYRYDSQDRIIEEGIGNATTKTTYDAFGRPLKKIDALGHETLIEYQDDKINEKGQIVASVQTKDSLGNITEQINDIDGNLATLIRKNIFSNILFREDYEYDLTGNRIAVHTTVIQPNHNQNVVTTRFTYNWEGNVISSTEAVNYPEQKITKHEYNKFGQKVKTIKPDGTAIQYTYDKIGRLSSLTANNIFYEYQYDQNDNPVQIRSQNGKTTRAYDDHNRIVSETLENGLTVNYTYDCAGQIIRLTYPDGSESRYSYSGDRLINVSRNNYTHEYLAFNDQGIPIQSRLIDKSEMSTSYDLLGRVTDISAPGWKCNQISYDAVGQLISTHIEDKYGQLNPKYTYDDLYQLTSENGAETNYFENDSVSNIVLKNDIKRENNSLNQLLCEGDDCFAYDANGNLVRTPELTLVYDALDRLIEVQCGAESITYCYDPWNRRMSKSNGERYLYVGQNEVGAYLNNRCLNLRLLGVGKGAEIGASVAIELEGVPYAPIHDLTGNIIALVNTETYRYTAYGKQIESTNLNNPWQFASKRFDPETRFVNFGRRYYSPEMMKWITPDPIGYEDGPNLYAYVRNNPLTHWDKYGLFRSRISSIIREFSESFGRGALDDTTLGLSEYALGEYQCHSIGQYAGYYSGMASSLIVGLAYGGTEAKVAKWVGQGIFHVGKAAYYTIIGNKFSHTVSKGVRICSNLEHIASTIGKIEKSEAKVLFGSRSLKKNVLQLDLDTLSQAGQVLDRGGLTKAGRALDKHGGRVNSVFPKATGNIASKNKHGQFCLDNILTDPNNQSIFFNTKRFGYVIDIQTPKAGGARFSNDGKFIGFLEP